MKKLVSAISTAYILFVALTLALPSVAASTGTVSIVDLRHLDPSIIKFNGSPSFGYSPVITHVQQGGTVTFTNMGSEPHTVTSFSSRASFNLEGALVQIPVPDGVFDSGPLNVGSSFTLNTANLAPGTYWIFCEFHPWMVGAVVVSVSGSQSVSTSIRDSGFVGGQFFAGSAAWGFLPRNLEVKQGTIITFTNNGNIAHTVTSGVDGAPDAGALWDFTPVLPGTSVTLDTSSLAPGTYVYHCDFHPWMTGAIKIDA